MSKMSKENHQASLLNSDVYQSNELIEAMKEMNTSSYRLFLLGLCKLRPHLSNDEKIIHDTEFPITIFSHKELLEVFNGNPAGIRNLRKNLKKAYGAHITINESDGGFYFEHIYKKMHYKPSVGLMIQFDESMKPYLLDLLNKRYTRFMLKDTFLLESTYAWRLCERMLKLQGIILQRKKKEVSQKFTIEELREALGVDENLYVNRMNNFKRFILDKPIEEINEKTKLEMRYEQYKEGRKIAGFTIFMKFKKDIAIPTIDEQYKEPPAIDTEANEATPALMYEPSLNVVDVLKKEGLKPIQINSIRKKYPDRDIIKSYKIACEHADNKHLRGDDRKRYIKACIERNIYATNAMNDEIREREEQKTKEKIEAQKAMSAGFKKIFGMTDESEKQLEQDVRNWEKIKAPFDDNMSSVGSIMNEVATENKPASVSVSKPAPEPIKPKTPEEIAAEREQHLQTILSCYKLNLTGTMLDKMCNTYLNMTRDEFEKKYKNEIRNI